MPEFNLAGPAKLALYPESFRNIEIYGILGHDIEQMSALEIVDHILDDQNSGAIINPDFIFFLRESPEAVKFMTNYANLQQLPKMHPTRASGRESSQHPDGPFQPLHESTGIQRAIFPGGGRQILDISFPANDQPGEEIELPIIERQNGKVTRSAGRKFYLPWNICDLDLDDYSDFGKFISVQGTGSSRRVISLKDLFSKKQVEGLKGHNDYMHGLEVSRELTARSFTVNVLGREMNLTFQPGYTLIFALPISYMLLSNGNIFDFNAYEDYWRSELKQRTPPPQRGALIREGNRPMAGIFLNHSMFNFQDFYEFAQKGWIDKTILRDVLLEEFNNLSGTSMFYDGELLPYPDYDFASHLENLLAEMLVRTTLINSINAQILNKTRIQLANRFAQNHTFAGPTDFAGSRHHSRRAQVHFEEYQELLLLTAEPMIHKLEQSEQRTLIEILNQYRHGYRNDFTLSQLYTSVLGML